MTKQKVTVSFEVDVEFPEDHRELHDAIKYLGSEMLVRGDYSLDNVKEVFEIYSIEIDIKGADHVATAGDAVQWFERVMEGVRDDLWDYLRPLRVELQGRLVRKEDGAVVLTTESQT